MFSLFRKKTNINSAEACGLLGITPDANVIEIKKAYITKMRKFHPDHGGDEYIAARLNWARDVLLKSSM